MQHTILILHTEDCIQGCTQKSSAVAQKHRCCPYPKKILIQLLFFTRLYLILLQRLSEISPLRLANSLVVSYNKLYLTSRLVKREKNQEM